MKLAADVMSMNTMDAGFVIKKEGDSDQVIALAGNPNVGKSTIFNHLTGLNQHTGNWPGKTVTNAQGNYTFEGINYILVDIPGTYSLMAHSIEEEVARDFICFGNPDTVIVVCDATCLERNFNLVLQTIEITPNVIVCVNLMDQAMEKQILIDFGRLKSELGVPVIGISAARGDGLDRLMKAVAGHVQRIEEKERRFTKYTSPIEEAISILEPIIAEKLGRKEGARWISLKLLEGDKPLLSTLQGYLGSSVTDDPTVLSALKRARAHLYDYDISHDQLQDTIVSCIVKQAEDICSRCVQFEKPDYNATDRKIDKILTSKLTGIPLMLALLAVIFWLTITGSNYPSKLLSIGLFWIQDRLMDFANYAGAPQWFSGALIFGVYRVVAWVIAVMLPPMAIFFPLFTSMEDLGYLPRVAFNLDNQFKKCRACGKQALTMCMGFGCNAVGVVGCRIIDSPRERLLAIITNNFVPCNGRFPTLIAIITMFFITDVVNAWQGAASAVLLTAVIVIGVLMTFLVSRILSGTILKGIPSSFTLELPPYRKPQIIKIIVRSIFDRTLFVLGRAISVAAPAGLIIWLTANIMIGDMSLLAHCSGFLDPFARLIGLDGVILMAFILGFPANEIVIPIIIMAYLSTDSILELDSLIQLKELLVSNGWTWLTALCTMLFSLMHWPCSTTCLTIKKETQSLKWTVIAFAVPTVTGTVVCFLVASIVRLLGQIYTA